jgi:hypothetical protein
MTGDVTMVILPIPNSDALAMDRIGWKRIVLKTIYLENIGDVAETN